MIQANPIAKLPFMAIPQAPRSPGKYAAYLLIVLVNSAVSAPTIQQTTGTFNHKATVTITGAGFGTKPMATPIVWDDASGNNILSKWDGAWPNSNPAYNTTYRTPIRGIGLPHNHVTRYIAGAHGDSGGATSGYTVLFYKLRTISSYPAYTYASWYHRLDNAWVFGDPDGVSGGAPLVGNNIKNFVFSGGAEPYTGPYWYLEYNDIPYSSTSIAKWHGNALPDRENWWSTNAVNPASGVWTKIEMEIKYANQSDGYIKIWENGVLQMTDYVGTTDNLTGRSSGGTTAGTLRSEGIGGYGWPYGQPNNWRYFADVYLDYSLARAVLANNSNLSSATIIENQIPTVWSDGSISVSVNLGKFSPGQTAYLFIFDPTGTRNNTGFPVTIGGAGGTMKPPANVR